MSLSLRYRPDAFSKVDNMWPVRSGVYRSRPGATQLVAGNVTGAVEWDSRVVFCRDGRCYVWDTAEYDVAAAGILFDATAFQALTQDAAREDRLYVADGVNPLWYIRRQAGGYERKTFVNEVADPLGTPYPLRPARAVATHRNRLWTADGSNRIEHSDHENPHSWDPLFSLEFQAGERSGVHALAAQETYLAVGTPNALWAVSGDSQFNWQRDQVLKESGVVGPHAMDGDGKRLAFASKTGLRLLGSDGTVGDDRLDDVFEVPDTAAQVALSGNGRLLFALVFRRLFVVHLGSGDIGEVAQDISGIFTLGGRLAWYGPDGIWVCNRTDGFDERLGGDMTRVHCAIETWPDVRPDAALLERVYLLARGESSAPITYTAEVDGKEFSRVVRGAPKDSIFADFWDGAVIDWKAQPQHHQLPIYAGGRSFVHRVECQGHFELQSFTPQFRRPLERRR